MKPRQREIRSRHRLVVQIQAVRALHQDHGGRCVHCGTEWPCETLRVMREARGEIR